MRIVFTTSGGFAPVASLNAPLPIDVSALPEREEKELRQLLERTEFFELPTRCLRPHGADARTYTITVEDEARSHTVTLADPVPPGDLRVLVERLRWHAVVARRSRSGP
ncbi:MAG: protealysin inhibitor emfourin [Acidobacteriota bacterium]